MVPDFPSLLPNLCNDTAANIGHFKLLFDIHQGYRLLRPALETQNYEDSSYSGESSAKGPS